MAAGINSQSSRQRSQGIKPWEVWEIPVNKHCRR
nr:MAG TPA: hypothetical protein [Caudoviricetes sp.]